MLYLIRDKIIYIHSIREPSIPLPRTHSTVGLAQQWDQLDQLGMRMQHNLEQQIQARNQSGVSEDALKEFSMMIRHVIRTKLESLISTHLDSVLDEFYQRIINYKKINSIRKFI